MRLIVPLSLLLLLSACGGKHEHKVENLYALKAVEYSRDGVEAMRIERWSAAERAFGRSLKAAQLADDHAMVVHAWYNLGSVRAAQHKPDAGEAFGQAIVLAERYAMGEMQLRARLSRALWQTSNGQQAERVDLGSGRWPADIWLMAGRLAQMQQSEAEARNDYQQAIRSSGKDAAGLKMQAEAHMGLALLARIAGDAEAIRAESAKALELCRQTGAPRLTAHLLLLRASVPGVAAQPADEVERAYSIYEVLADVEGQRQSLQLWQSLAREGGNTALADELAAKLARLAPADTSVDDGN